MILLSPNQELSQAIVFYWKAIQFKVEYALPGAMAESADATDLKSVGGNTVRVRPPLAPLFHTVIASGIQPPSGNLKE